MVGRRDFSFAVAMIGLAVSLTPLSPRAADFPFGPWMDMDLGMTEECPPDVHPVDIDGDGDIDILYVCFPDSQIIALVNQGGPMPSFVPRILSNNASGVSSIFPVDLNEDGSIDILIADALAQEVRLLVNDGGAIPAFTDQVLFATPDLVSKVKEVDFDDDGDLDILTGSFHSNSHLAWYENDGSFQFTFHFIAEGTDDPTPESPLRPFLTAQRVVDIDGDGDIDIVTSSLSSGLTSGRLAWFENDGLQPASFTPHVIEAHLGLPLEVFIADLNGDNHMDILVALFLDFRVAWYENDGASMPSFSRHTIDSDLQGTRSVFAIDLDLDGDMDVLAAGSWIEPGPPPPIEFTSYRFYENLGLNSGQFGREEIRGHLGQFHNNVRIRAADLDGDGDPDPIIGQTDAPSLIGWRANLTITRTNAALSWSLYE